MFDLNKIETVIIVMMENRSFDHLLGYLRLPPFNRKDIDGLRPGMSNVSSGVKYPVFRWADPNGRLPGDPPHEREDIAIQLTNLPGPAGPPPHSMNGFVTSYASKFPVSAGNPPVPMSYFSGEDLPAMDFFARQYCVCDRWFAALPTGTQPNRLMAFAGYTWIDHNRGLLLPAHDLVYDWLSARRIRWRVYHHGLPFFMLLENWCVKVVLDPHFRSYDRFGDDWHNEAKKRSPQVIFLEPRYADAPHFEPPNDDHPPVPVAAGQQFLLRIFSDLMTNPDRWSRSALILTYDEHGGFFDHVSPEPVRTDPPKFPGFVPFESTGVRVPGLVISPFVEPGSVCRDRLDHTSMLKFLGAKFGGGSYTPIVDARPVGDLTSALTLSKPRSDSTLPSPAVKSGFVPEQEPSDPIPQAFKTAVLRAMKARPSETRAKFPELFSHFRFQAARRRHPARRPVSGRGR